MKKRYDSELTIEELAKLSDSEIDTSDIAELDASFWKGAQVILPQDRSNSSPHRD